MLTDHWTDWVDYWAVDFDYESRREIIKVPIGFDLPSPSGREAGGKGSSASAPSATAEPSSGPSGHLLPGGEGKASEFEERWTGNYIFENEWQSFRTRKQRELELVTAEHSYDRPGRYTVAVKVVDIFGNDTMTLVPVNLG